MAYMSYTTVSDPKWNDFGHTSIDCKVRFDAYPNLGPLNFTANPLDTEPHGVEIFNRCVAGDFGPVAEYVAPVILPQSRPLTPEQFYGWLDGLGKIDPFVAAIEQVEPVAKKLTCRNQFNNSTLFAWDMVLMTHVAPKLWGDTWQVDLASSWVAAAL